MTVGRESTQPGVHLQIRKRAVSSHRAGGHLDLGLPALRGSEISHQPVLLCHKASKTKGVSRVRGNHEGQWGQRAVEGAAPRPEVEGSSSHGPVASSSRCSS